MINVGLCRQARMTNILSLRFAAHVAIPSQKDIEEALLQRKKQEMMQMYALDEFDELEQKMTAKKKEEEKTKVEAT